MRPTLPRQLRLRKTWRIPNHDPSPRVTAAPEQTALRAAYYRGGTSHAVILQPQDLPASYAKWKPLFRQVLKSVGLGEAYGRSRRMGSGRIVPGTASMGNICLVEPYHQTKEDDATSPHVDYTYVSVDAKYGDLDVEANSGNLLSAVGPYAYNARLLPPDLYAIKDGEITITIRNTNTMMLVESTFSVVGGQAAVTGSHKVDGVNGKGAKISLSFRDPTCSTTGKRFPTGRAVDMVEGYEVTCVDGAVPVVFIRADAVGVPGTILPHELTQNKDAMELLENIRRAAAVEMGIADTKKTALRTIPKIAIVSQSCRHSTVSGSPLVSSQMDLVVRFISDTEPHPAIPLTGALTTAVAARMPRTVVEQLLAPEEVMPGTLTIAHPSGRIQVELDYEAGTKPSVWVAKVSSTAQRLFQGNAFWTEPPTDAKADSASETNTALHSRGLTFIKEVRQLSSPSEMINRFYQEGHNTNSDFATALTKDPEDRPQPPKAPPQPKADLALPTPSRNRETAHLLRELWSLRHSLTHFTKQYPSKSSSPVPQSVSHCLSAIATHVDTLTTALKPMPRPPRTVVPDRSKGAEWHLWAKKFAAWDRRKGPREAAKKQEKWEQRKPGWDRWRDSELNAVDKRGRFVVRGERREKLLRGEENGKVKAKEDVKDVAGRAQRDQGEGVVRKKPTRHDNRRLPQKAPANPPASAGSGSARATAAVEPALREDAPAPALEVPPPPSPAVKWPSFKARLAHKKAGENEP